MNPWLILLNVVGWTLLTIFAVAVLVFVVLFIIFLVKEIRSSIRRRKQPNFLMLKGEIGETVILQDRQWRTDFIETDYDIDMAQDRLRITMTSRRY